MTARLPSVNQDHQRLGSLLPRLLSHGAPGWAYGLVMLCASVAIVAGQEPSYNGRLLSQWLGDMSLRSYSAGHVPYEEAIRAMGTNAIPTLLKWISCERPPTEQSRETGAVPRGRWHTLSPEELADSARAGFRLLGVVARPAIPELARLARTSSDPERAERCTSALAFIGPEAIPSLGSLATNSPPWTRYEAVNALEYFSSKPEGAQALPVLIQCLSDTEASYPVGGSAERVLVFMGPAVAMPALTNAFRSSSARTRLGVAHCLMGFEYSADPRVSSEVLTMVPALRAAMRDPDYQVRDEATNILRRMGGWHLFDGKWVGRDGTNTLNGITPDFFTDAPPR